MHAIKSRAGQEVGLKLQPFLPPELDIIEQIYNPTAFTSEIKSLACVEWNAFWATELVFVILGEIKVPYPCLN